MFLSGVFRQQNYLQPWKPGYSAAMTDPRMRLAAHGLLAASGHNMQPWRIKLDQKNDKVFTLYADNRRLSPAVDPEARQLMISQGTFLEYVRIAGQQLGYRVDIKLFPEGDYDESRLEESMASKPVARLTLNNISLVSQPPLYNYLFQPDTNRGPYTSDKLSPAQVKDLQSINDISGLQMNIVQDAENMKVLGDYAEKAAVIEAGVDSVMQESARIFRANEREKNQFRDGFSVEGQGTSGIMRHILQGAVTLFPSMNEGKAASKQFINSTTASVNSTPAYALIISDDNSRVSQVRSGMLYSRLTLTAHLQGLAMQPLSQVLEEYPEMSGLYSGIHRRYAAPGQTIQMLARVGTPLKTVPLSMRRDVLELLDDN
ncbi:hypothetical protein KC345_g11379 [Hortaea werneckii]|nr:hypothetical protein KC345_g11379 [Hortaea werneckii]